MKRRIILTIAVAVLAVLSMASVAQAASVAQSATRPKPTVALTAAVSGNTYSLTCKVRNLTSVRTIALHHEIRVVEPDGTLVGIPIPWTSNGSRRLQLRYGNGGYWAGTISFLFGITPPVMPGDAIVCRWIASYGSGSGKVTGAVVDVQVGVGTP